MRLHPYCACPAIQLDALRDAAAQELKAVSKYSTGDDVPWEFLTPLAAPKVRASCLSGFEREPEASRVPHFGRSPCSLSRPSVSLVYFVLVYFPGEKCCHGDGPERFCFHVLVFAQVCASKLGILFANSCSRTLKGKQAFGPVPGFGMQASAIGWLGVPTRDVTHEAGQPDCDLTKGVGAPLKPREGSFHRDAGGSQRALAIQALHGRLSGWNWITNGLRLFSG